MKNLVKTLLVGTMLLGSVNTFAYEQEIYDIKPLE